MMTQNKPWEERVQDMDDVDLVVQALQNVGASIGGSTKFALYGVATEIKRLRRVKQQQHDIKRRSQEQEWVLHHKKTGEKHPDDDVPF